MTYGSLDEEVRSLFDWNPPFVRPVDRCRCYGCVESEPEFRVSGIYDQHISDALTLKRVVHVPGLHKRIAEQAVSALQARKDSGMPIATDWGSHASAAKRDEICADYSQTKIPPDLVSELQTRYKQTAASFCLPMASALALHPAVWGQLAYFSPDSMKDGWDIWDGSVQLREGADPKNANSLEDLNVDVDKRDQLHAVYKEFPDLVTVETPKLWHGDKDVMFAMQLLISNSCSCDSFLCRTASEPDGPNFAESTMHHSRADMVDSSIIMDALSLNQEAKHATHPSDSSVEQTSEQCFACHEQILDQALARSGTSFKRVEADYKRYWWGVLRKSVSDPAAAAQRLLQQAWADSVRQRTSVFVIYAGNFEIIGLRDRQTQTLYVSDVLYAPGMTGPGYGQVQVGLYLLAFNDALQHADLLKQDDATSVLPRSSLLSSGEVSAENSGVTIQPIKALSAEKSNAS